jgi:DNA-damage-inducible protein J
MGTEDLIMAHSTMLHVRVDDEIKTQASEVLAAMGLTVPDAVRILLKRIVSDQAFPQELKVPNAQTRAAMEEARAMMKARVARCPGHIGDGTLLSSLTGYAPSS